MVPLEAEVAALRRPDTYPEAPTRIDVLETHMSWVFLTPDRVYKLKKPVRYSFLDFRSLDARRHYCEEEVRLNRWLAPSVYLGTVPLMRDLEGDLRLGGAGAVVDWLVAMVRLPAERMLDHLIRTASCPPDAVVRVGEVLARFFYAAAPVELGPEAYHTALAGGLEETLHELRHPAWELPAEPLAALSGRLQRWLAARRPLFEARARAGRIVDGHGDLRPEHICLLEPPVVIDCIEFNPALRIVDPVEDLAFLSLECDRLGAPEIGRRVLEVYARQAGDPFPAEILGFHKAARACVRAKLALWHLRDAEEIAGDRWRGLAHTYLELAGRNATALPAP